jgi:hypothetical protein
MVEIVRAVSEDEWRRFCNGCSDSTIYHTPEWADFLKKTFNYTPYYLFATDECGTLVGMLALAQVKSRVSGNRLCSTPFAHDCSCLGDKDVCTALIDETVRIRNQHHINKIEIRHAVGHDGFSEVNSFCEHVVALSAQPQGVFKLFNKNVRGGIKKSEKAGVSVTTSTDPGDLRTFYELNRLTKKNLGVPCHPWKFFKNMFSVLDGHVSLSLSWYNDEIVAGGLFEYYKDQVLYGYAAADPKAMQVTPNHALVWKTIQDACGAGYRTFNFGRSSYDNKGLIQFKHGWGAEERELYYSIYPGSSRQSLPSRESFTYLYGRKVIRHIPMAVYSKMSDMIYPHLG